MSEEYLLENSLEKGSKKETMAEFMLNKEAIKKTPFLKYLRLYLDYMSYVNNVYSVDSGLREAAAKIYFQLNISENIPSELKGNYLVD